MPISLTHPKGQVHIHEDVLSAVAGYAARECHGIAGVAARNVPEGIGQLLGVESLHRGVQVQPDGDGLAVSLYLIVEYGVNILEVARGVMARVSHRLEELSGLRVKRVDVHVQGVRVERGADRQAHPAPGRRRVPVRG